MNEHRLRHNQQALEADSPRDADMMKDRLNAQQQFNYREAAAKLEQRLIESKAVSPQHIDCDRMHSMLNLTERQMGQFIEMLRTKDGVCITKHCVDRPCAVPYYELTW